MKGLPFAFLVVFLVGCSPQWSLHGRAGASAPSLDHLAYAVHRRTNEVRASRGLPVLGWRGGLAGAADRHSLDMARRSYFAHRTPEGASPSDRARDVGLTCRVRTSAGRTRVGVSENLFLSARYRSYRVLPSGARQYRWLGADEIAAQAVSAWMASPAHRRALLDPVSSGRGVGVAVSEDQRVYITDVLC